MSERIPLSPQPKHGKPYRIDFVNRGPEYWYQERTAYIQSRGRRGPMFMSWRCPYGADGEPELVDGIWVWKQRTAANAAGGE